MSKRAKDEPRSSSPKTARRALNAAPAIATRGVSIAASFLLTIVVARLLGPGAGGVFFVVLTSVAVFGTFARFGTDNLALKLCGAARASLRREVASLFTVCCVGGVLAVGLAAAAYALFHSSVPGLTAGLALATASAVVPQALSVLAGGVLRGNGALTKGTLAELGSVPFFTLCIILLEASVSPPTLDGAVLALVTGCWLTAAWSVPAAVISLFRVAPRGEPGASTRSLDFVKRHLGGLSAMMGTSLLFYLLTWAPQYVLTATSGTDDVAFYTVAARLAAFITLVPSIQVAYLAPSFARLFHHNQLAELNALCSRSTRQAAIVAALPTLIFIAGAEPLIRLLYGTDFEGAAVPLVLLTLGAYLGVLLGQTNQLMLLCELEHSALLLNLGWLVAWATVGIWLSALGGVVAVSSFILVSSVLYSLSSVVLLAKRRAIYSFARFRTDRYDYVTERH